MVKKETLLIEKIFIDFRKLYHKMSHPARYFLKNTKKISCRDEEAQNGGHVPSEVLGNSFSLYVDQMYGKYIDGAVRITKKEAVKQTENGGAETATGKDVSEWINSTDEPLFNENSS